MTIGPAPMMRMVLRSLRFGISVLLHRSNEPVEQRRNVMRSRTRFRMPLEAERRSVSQRDALVAAVEQRTMGDASVARQRRLVDRETVVLRGDHHAAAVQVDHGV